MIDKNNKYTCNSNGTLYRVDYNNTSSHQEKDNMTEEAKNKYNYTAHVIYKNITSSSFDNPYIHNCSNNIKTGNYYTIIETSNGNIFLATGEIKSIKFVKNKDY